MEESDRLPDWLILALLGGMAGAPAPALPATALVGDTGEGLVTNATEQMVYT